ncbi:hypothetical protein [Shimazuella soli]|uniref:hypothetical protein n=1 Tax=Shimazuella soli TaxID=1892854 RepID=UPI0030B80DA7
MGFSQESKEQVNQINQRLKEDGYTVKPPTQLHTWTFYVETPDNFTVEVYHEVDRNKR